MGYVYLFRRAYRLVQILYLSLILPFLGVFGLSLYPLPYLDPFAKFFSLRRFTIWFIIF